MCVHMQNTAKLAPCTHEEADTRIMMHVYDALSKGFQHILVRTVDTDVVVLAVAGVCKLGIRELWVAFGTGKDFRYIPAHEISASVGPTKSIGLPMFYAYTGCDTVSAFATIGKRTAWNTWMAFDNVSMVFTSFCVTHSQCLRNQFLFWSNMYTILLYDRTSTCTNINEAHKQLFAIKGRTIGNIPPTKAALEQHIKRAIYQGGFVWGQLFEIAPALPSPSAYGWAYADGWMPLWTMLPEASNSCRELICCGCKKDCRGRCKCVKAVLKCTALCKYGGLCER